MSIKESGRVVLHETSSNGDGLAASVEGFKVAPGLGEVDAEVVEPCGPLLIPFSRRL